MCTYVGACVRDACLRACVSASSQNIENLKPARFRPLTDITPALKCPMSGDTRRRVKPAINSLTGVNNSFLFARFPPKSRGNNAQNTVYSSLSFRAKSSSIVPSDK